MPKNTGPFPGGTTSAHAENTFGHKCLKIGFGNYLRARGEYHSIFFQNCWITELPPRTRRILKTLQTRRSKGGTTSAHAENTGWGFTMATSHGNYLRARGEYTSSRTTQSQKRELPPRTRRIPEYPHWEPSG